MHFFGNVCVCDVYCVFVTFPCGVLGQVWYLIVLIPELCLLSYFVSLKELILVVLVAIVMYLPLEEYNWNDCGHEKSLFAQKHKNVFYIEDLI